MPCAKLVDKVIVITDAARGIGFATARMAAAQGASVVIVDLDQACVEAAVANIVEDGFSAIGVSGDVSDLAQVRQNVEQISAVHGRVDVLVNNAAINSYHPPESLPEHHWHREIAVCLTGSFFWAQAVANAFMIPAQKGSIVNLGSGGALAALPRMTAYTAAKHGVVGLTKSLAVDWGQFNIRVNCVCPGLTETELAKQSAQSNPEAARERELRIPLGRRAQPDDIARAILFFASDDADAISGVALSVDGGTLAMSAGYSPPRKAS